MKKLENSDQCEYKTWIGGKVFCEHPEMRIRYCEWSSDFPIGCPLETDCKVNKDYYENERYKKTTRRSFQTSG